ncbi:MAG: ThiF family adenylyltransferase [Armatimonadetes bacterium]|nr:ThiF family adenylyltransferase [Armatimonadota bacterium]
MQNAVAVTIEELFQRSLTAHLPPEEFTKLKQTTVLVAGLGGGSNVAELLIRKGIGSLVIADLDVYEPHNIRQRGAAVSTHRMEKVGVMLERLGDINPHARIVPVFEGIQSDNVEELVGRAGYVVDAIDLHALREKAALYRAARKAGKYVLSAPSMINGALLYVFSPDGVTFEEFFEYEDGLPILEAAPRILKRVGCRFPPEAPKELYEAAARGERTIPLDAVGVDQGAVMVVGAIENLILGRMSRVVTVPRMVQVDVTDPLFMGRIVDYSADFGEEKRR